jgi:hypothetical protein
MIVREAGPDLLFITQPDHAALAARMMAAWRADGLPFRASRAAVLHATREHDLGWREEDAAPRVDASTGRPFDFINLPRDARQAVWRRALPQLADDSTYVAAMVAQHALTIYRRHRADPAWVSFFDEMEAARDEWYTAGARPDGTSGGPIDPPVHERLSFLQDYAMLRLGDLLSLTFCLAWTDRQEFEGYTIAAEGDRVTVSPDPFEDEEVPIEVTARRIPRQRFTSDDDLRAALAAAGSETLTGRLVGSSPVAQ